jgi:hypothetical protein
VISNVYQKSDSEAQNKHVIVPPNSTGSEIGEKVGIADHV